MNTLSAAGLGRPRRRDRGRGPAAGRARRPGGPGRRRPVPGDRRAEGPPGHRLRAGRAADGGDRGGDPAGSAVVRLPGGRSLPALGGALDADLPAGQPGDRGAAGAAGQRLGGHRVRPHGARRADPGGRAGDRAAAAARPLQRHPGPALVDPARPRLPGGPAPDRQGRDRGLAGAVHRAHAGGRRRPADRQGAGRPAQRRPPLRLPGRPCAAGRLPPPAGAGLDRAAGRGDRGRVGGDRRARAARAGPGDVLPGPDRLHAADRGARRPGRGRAGRARWRCWSVGPRARTAGCR